MRRRQPEGESWRRPTPAGNPWRKGGPSERAPVGHGAEKTIQRDGDAWNYLPQEQCTNRAYRWGEDGIRRFATPSQNL